MLYSMQKTEVTTPPSEANTATKTPRGGTRCHNAAGAYRNERVYIRSGICKGWLGSVNLRDSDSYMQVQDSVRNVGLVNLRDSEIPKIAVIAVWLQKALTSAQKTRHKLSCLRHFAFFGRFPPCPKHGVFWCFRHIFTTISVFALDKARTPFVAEKIYKYVCVASG